MSSSDGETPDWDALRDEELARHVEEIRARRGQGPLPADVEFVRYVSQVEFARVHARCFRDHGFDVRETFDDGLDLGRGEQWTPYSFVSDPRSDEEWQALNEDCPQYPATSAIYGDLTEG